MIDLDSLPWLVPLIGYLEMHYRLPVFPFSRYFRHEPEIFADAPHRVEPGQKIPVTILVKDADRFPITLKSVLIRIKSDTGNSSEIKKEYHHHIQDHWFEEIIEIDPGDFRKPVRIWVIIEIDVAGKNRTIITHNIKTTGQFLLDTFIDEEPLPGSPDYWWGDLHYHSNYTEDFVEFGASLKSSQKTATALGLDFLAVTDHSYDLDDNAGSWLETDPELKKWYASRSAIEKCNTDSATLLIPGEEVTGRNSKGRNIHILVLNHPSFFPGSGDGAERFFRTKTELSIAEIIESQSNNTLVMAAHPYQPFPFIERLLLRRGIWGNLDSQLGDLTGLQILNGTFNQIVQDSIAHWIQLLLEGGKKFIYAGNDAHGNYNRFHQIKLPMWSTLHNREHILGLCRTGVMRSETKSVDAIITGLKAGRCIITDGPALTITIDSIAESYTLGDIVKTNNNTININCTSSSAFGSISSLTIFKGIIGETAETEYIRFSWDRTTYRESISQKMEWREGSGYLRCHLVTKSGHQCYTNPIWINPQ